MRRMEKKLFKTLSFCIVAQHLIWAGKLDASPIRSRRGLTEFDAMITCASTTGHSGLDYVLYGCHCGLGGSGTPVDDVDRCCVNHDICWGDLYDEGTCDRSVALQFTSYDYSQSNCNQSEPQITCNAELNDPCQQALCECDKIAAVCFAQATYNEEYRSYNKAEKCKDPSASPGPTTMTTTPSPFPSTPDTAQKSPSPVIQVVCMTCTVSVYIMYIMG